MRQVGTDRGIYLAGTALGLLVGGQPRGPGDGSQVCYGEGSCASFRAETWWWRFMCEGGGGEDGGIREREDVGDYEQETDPTPSYPGLE